MLALSKISKTYKSEKILVDFSHIFERSGFYCLKGANGIGKTTLLKIIKGMVLPDSGTMCYESNKNSHMVCTYVDSNTRSFFHRLSVGANLEYFQALDKKTIDRDAVRFLFRLFNFENIFNKKFSSLSLGQMQIVAIIRGLLEQPNILLLDEALANLDSKTIDILSRYLIDYTKSFDRIIIVCSHTEQLKVHFEDTITLS